MSPEAQALELAHYIYERQGSPVTRPTITIPRTACSPTSLDRRLGIPSPWGSSTREIARRVGVPARGVSFPGHFLVHIDRKGSEGARWWSIRFGGRILDEKALVALLKRVVETRETLRAEHLEARLPAAHLGAHAHQFEGRLLGAGRNSRALLALDRLVSLTPDAPFALRERGLLAARLGS